MTDSQQVRNAGISFAIIVDDGYDEIPQVAELQDEGAWESLFDDAQGGEARRIEAIFPTYDPGDREELKANQDFIDALWRNRDEIQDLLGELFDTYEQKISDNRPFLVAAEAALSALDIRFERRGRDFVDSAVDADLIVIDLFLGIQQGLPDREVTVAHLKKAIAARRARGLQLPSIVLMSQIPALAELAKNFRREVKLHASAFRHIRKNDLATPGRLTGLILTLAAHRADSHALATFVETWESKSIDAVRDAAGTLRKIDIDDLQHIRSMLLRFEGLNTSSYMLDVFDRVLQFEIESHGAVLDAAIALDDIADNPAPLMISNDRDTYAVLEKTLYVNPRRRSHATGAVWPIAFGDVLGPRPGTAVKSRGFFSGREDLVFFVASPACDLIRKDGLTTALLVAGTLKEVDMGNPGLRLTAQTTPIMVKEGRRFQVDWDFGELRTISLDQAKRLLHPNSGDMAVVSRLREGPAISLRQLLLSNVGRIGELAPLPRSMKFQANIYFPLQQGGIQEITLPRDVAITGNVLIPRKGNYATAIVDSNCEVDLTAALLNLDLTNIARQSERKFAMVKEQTRIRQLFRSGFQGVSLPLNEPREAGLLRIGEEQPDSDDKKPKIDSIATIVTGDNVGKLQGKKLLGAGLIVQVQISDPA